MGLLDRISSFMAKREEAKPVSSPKTISQPQKNHLDSKDRRYNFVILSGKEDGSRKIQLLTYPQSHENRGFLSLNLNSEEYHYFVKRPADAEHDPKLEDALLRFYREKGRPLTAEEIQFNVRSYTEDELAKVWESYSARRRASKSSGLTE